MNAIIMQIRCITSVRGILPSGCTQNERQIDATLVGTIATGSFLILFNGTELALYRTGFLRKNITYIVSVLESLCSKGFSEHLNVTGRNIKLLFIFHFNDDAKAD